MQRDRCGARTDDTAITTEANEQKDICASSATAWCPKSIKLHAPIKIFAFAITVTCIFAEVTKDASENDAKKYETYNFAEMHEENVL